MTTPSRGTIGALQCVVFPETPVGSPRLAVICCHGFGAPGTDLVPLRDELVELQPALASARFIFPAAPIDLADEGFGGGARAWWPIDMMQMQSASADELRELRKREPEGMATARKLLHKLVDEVCAQTKLPMNRVLLMGFSQGAMIATDLALRLEEAPAGLGILSGTLLTESVWKPKALARAGLPVFQSHGRQDPVLGFGAAEALAEVLQSAGTKHTFHPFDGGHTIGLGALRALAGFIAALM